MPEIDHWDACLRIDEVLPIEEIGERGGGEPILPFPPDGVVIFFVVRRPQIICHVRGMFNAEAILLKNLTDPSNDYGARNAFLVWRAETKRISVRNGVITHICIRRVATARKSDRVWLQVSAGLRVIVSEVVVEISE